MSTKVHHFSMESSLFTLLLLWLLLLLIIPRSHSFINIRQLKCHKKERNVLLDFKATFYDESCNPDPFGANLTTWTVEGENRDCCYWDGVICDNYTGHVIGLNLYSSCLFGSINSSSSIFKLNHLQRLDLSLNDFAYSTIPSAITNLSQLESLYLAQSNFSGQIPLGILQLTNLSSLYLSSNQLTLMNPNLRDLAQTLVNLEELALNFVEISSSIPDSLSRLTSLRYLDLAGCKLQGEIPPSLANLTKLEEIDLSNNQLTGEISHQLVRLTKLENVYLSFNKISGQIPRTISHLKNLHSLFLNSNNFSGKVHLDMFFQLKSLERLDLSYNIFSIVIDSSIKTKSKLQYLGLASCNLRSFPLFLQSQNSLQRLDLSFNDISGEIPTWICNLSNLHNLFLGNNSLIGMIPQCFISMDGLKNLSFLDLAHNNLSRFESKLPLLKWTFEYLDLRSNQLKGSLPIPSRNSSILYYFVSNNEFSGELPTMMCDLVNLQIFDVGNNNLSGMIPRCLSNMVGMGNLSVLNLHNNNFNGPIPQVGKSRCNLMMMDVSYNQLEGPVPRDMENCTNLEFLNLGNNRITDVFPFWLGKLPTLSVLILRSNRFHGILEKPLGSYEFPKLQIIELSNNNFIGCLPAQYFEGWRAMKVDVHKEDQTMSYASYRKGSYLYFYTVTMTEKGINLEYTKIPKSLVGIDFSSNHFIGEIPKSIATLKGLHFLNLSNNMLTGSVPLNLNGLTNLESLDLSHNNLSGEIPQQLTDLTALSSFDVSFNQLTGPIPQFKQFLTFENTSYEGNSGLCGFPLSKKCENIIKALPPSSFKEDHSSRTWIEINWTIVSMGYTSGFVIGAVMGTNWKRGYKKAKGPLIKFVLN